MNKPDTPKINRIRKLMDEENLDVLVVRLAENVNFISGFFNVLGYACVVFPREAEPILIATSTEKAWYERGWVTDVRTFPIWDSKAVNAPQATHFGSNDHINRFLKEIAAEKKFPAERVGYEGSFEFISPPVIVPEPVVPAEPSKRALREAWPQAELVDCTNLLNKARAIKTAYDIEKLRIVHDVTAFGLAAWEEACRNNATEAEAGAAFQAAVTAKGIGHKGALFAQGWPQVVSGLNTGEWVYKPSTQRRIENGDFVIIELAVCVDGYYSDLTRTIVVGEPTKEQRRIFDLTYEAMQAGIEIVKPGVRAAELDRVAKEVLGPDVKYCLTHFGHGLGWKYHEPYPTITNSSEHVLEEGHYFAFEPGIYVPGLGGSRHEENLVVTATGYENLSSVAPISIS